MVVVHVIEVGSSRELRALVAVAELHVLQLLCLEVLHLVVLVVVARRLLVAYGVARVEAVVLVNLVVDSELRVEEVEVVVCPIALRAILVDVIVAWVLHAVAHVAVLQVYVRVQAREERPRLLGVDVEVRLPRPVAVILISGIEAVGLVLRPQHLAPVVADVFVPSAAERSLVVGLVVVVDAGHEAVEVVLHYLLSRQVAFQLRVGESVFAVVLVGLVLVVISVAVGIVQRDVRRPVLSIELAPDGLVVHLVIVVGLVPVVVHVALVVVVFATRVVASSV